MIKQFTDFPGNVVAFACQGRVTKADYDAVLVPAVTNALRTHNKLRLYYEPARISLSTPARPGKISKLECRVSRDGTALPSSPMSNGSSTSPISSVSSCPRRRKSFR